MLFYIFIKNFSTLTKILLFIICFCYIYYTKGVNPAESTSLTIVEPFLDIIDFTRLTSPDKEAKCNDF